jgi:hypothetical protein
MAEVGDLVQRTGDGRTGRILGGRAIKILGGAVCGLHRAHGDEKRGFLGGASKSRLTVCQWFGLKTGGDGFLRFGLKTSGDGFSRFGLKTGGRGFLVLVSKPAATVW